MGTQDPTVAKFAEFIRIKRGKMLVKDLAKKAGLSSAFVYMVQDKLSQPSISSASRLLEALGETWASFDEYARD